MVKSTSGLAGTVPTAWNAPPVHTPLLNPRVHPHDLLLEAFPPHPRGWARGLSCTVCCTRPMPAPPGPLPHPRALPRTWPAPRQLGLTQRGPWGLARSSLREGLCSAEPKSWERHALLPAARWLAARPGYFYFFPCRAEASGAGSQTKPVRPARPSEDTATASGRPLPGTERCLTQATGRAEGSKPPTRGPRRVL